MCIRVKVDTERLGKTWPDARGNKSLTAPLRSSDFSRILDTQRNQGGKGVSGAACKRSGFRPQVAFLATVREVGVRRLLHQTGPRVVRAHHFTYMSYRLKGFLQIIPPRVGDALECLCTTKTTTTQFRRILVARMPTVLNSMLSGPHSYWRGHRCVHELRACTYVWGTIDETVFAVEL